MRAVILKEGRLTYTDKHPMPVPQKGEALVRMSLSGICNTDLELIKGYMGYGGILGHEFVGVVEGGDVPDSLMGTRVVGEINAACGQCVMCEEGMPTHCSARSVLGILGREGCMADYLVLPSENLHPLPDDVSDEAAVFVEPLAAAYEILEQVTVTPSMHLLVMGDGKLGLLCAMVLSTTGATVTLIGRHESKLSLAHPYGVVTTLASDISESDFDLVVEATGTPEGIKNAITLVRPRGTIVLKSTVAEGERPDLTPVVINEITLIGSRCGPFGPAIKALKDRAIDPTPLIGAVYPIEQAEEAFSQAARRGSLKVLLRT